MTAPTTCTSDDAEERSQGVGWIKHFFAFYLSIKRETTKIEKK
jgi:hypothetical protein